MKLFKRIYYPIIAVLFILVFVLSFVNATVGNKNNDLGDTFVTSVRAHLDKIASINHNSIYADKQEEVATYISSQLNSLEGLTQGTFIDEEESSYEYALSGEKPTGTYIVQRDTINEDTLKAIDEDRDDDVAVWEVDKEISNIIVYLPGQTTLSNYSANSTATGDVVMMMAHYDSRIEGAGASNSGVQVASMLQNIMQIVKDKQSFKNDLLFVFTDASEEGMYGAYMFKHQFVGFDDVYSRVKMGANFDALGNKGTLAMLKSSDNNSNLISAYGKINGNTFTSSMTDLIYGGAYQVNDFNIFGDIPSLSFATIGGGEVNNTAHDSIKNVTDSSIIQQANMMNSVIETFGDYDLSKLESKSNAVYFSYLDAFTIVFPYAVSYVLGALIILLLIGIILLNIKKKVFSWSRTGSGAVVQLLSIIGSLIILFALYFGFSLLTSLMGFMPIRAIGRLTFLSLGFLVSFMLLSLVSSAYLSLKFRKLFGINSADIVRGNVLIFAAIGAFLAFVFPHLAYFFAITAALELIVLLLVTLLSKKFKEKSGMPLGMLFPYLIPLLITAPMILPIITIASMSLSTVFIPLLMIIVILMGGFITPYIKLVEPAMEKLFSKIKLSRRVEQEITEMVEDKAKKGKFTEKTSIVIVKEKQDIKYRHGYLFAVLTVIISIFAIAFSSFTPVMGNSYQGYNSYRDAVYNSSVVLVYEKHDNDDARTFLMVDDFGAYNHVSGAIGGFSWDFGFDAYIKNIYNSSTIIGSNSAPEITSNGSEYSFAGFDTERNLVTLKLTEAQNITKLTITSSSGDTFEYENTAMQETIVINIPYKFGEFTMTTEGVDSINLEYTEVVMDIGNNTPILQGLEDWDDIVAFYASDADIVDYLNSGVVFKITKNRF